ncbi:metallothionein [Synechococcus sp. KORDI-100]|uniref:metallothionein n=1 Tax=Synechococcus sp. KORDI-100 TaxID=1280380 RepID=UPI0008FFAF58|nr:metallothionein [Synechococcus sp. KORDI-100]
MLTTPLDCACEPCGCQISSQTSVEKDGKTYCSQACADGHAQQDPCCSSCECC